MQQISLWIYNLAIGFYKAGVFCASLFSKKAALFREGRKLKLPELPGGRSKNIWFHCASLGEFEQARPVIEQWRKLHPADVIILSFFSPSGYEVRKNYEMADAVVYLPLDSAANARKFLDWARPDIALFVKYEFWFHYLNELKRREIPALLFCSIFRREQIFFRWYGGFFRSMLGMFSKILVQHEDSAGLLKSIGISSEVSRDTRFDRVLQVSEAKKTFAWVEQFRDHQNVLIAGSTWPKDEEMILSFMHRREGEGYKYIIVPHDIIPERLDALERNIRVPVVRFSQCKEADPAAVKVLIVDSIGHLSGLYAYGDVAYVGGGFNAGVHNVLEAAVYGIPVLFGPRYYKSLEAAELLNEKGACCVSNAEETKRGIDFISSKGKAGFLANRTYVVERAGGTQRVIEELEKLIRK